MTFTIIKIAYGSKKDNIKLFINEKSEKFKLKLTKIVLAKKKVWRRQVQ